MYTMTDGLGILTRHLDDAEQALDADAQPSVLRADARLAQHAHGVRAIARTVEELDSLQDAVDRSEVPDRRYMQLRVERGKAEVGQHWAERGCRDDKKAAALCFACVRSGRVFIRRSRSAVCTFGGRFAMSTVRVCSTALEKRGPTGAQSAHEFIHHVSAFGR